MKLKLFAILGILLLAGSGCNKNLPKNTIKNISDNKSASEIHTIIDKNLWYQPKPGVSWQWQLLGEINAQYEVDLYDLDLIETKQEIIDTLRSRGTKVICYFSAGSLENYRDDAGDFPADAVGKTLEGWPDEKWLDVSKYYKFANVIEKRLDLAVQKKCDGVEPDNVDGYQNDTGFNLTYADQLNYNKWLASEAHQRNLSIALKNDLEQVKDLVAYFDFSVNEQCFQYKECDLLLPFIRQNKAVLGVEYELDTGDFCEEANSLNFSWLKMKYELDGSRISCK